MSSLHNPQPVMQSATATTMTTNLVSLTTMASIPVSGPLPSTHFLAQSRPDVAHGVPLAPDEVDTSTLAAHDFDVDTRTGFMPPDPPLTRLPAEWEPWELVLDDAVSSRLQLGTKPDLTPLEARTSASWRAGIDLVRPVSYGSRNPSGVQLTPPSLQFH
jgi:hypothetical protein